MANYYCTVRTNYFKVDDEEKFLDLIGNTYAEDNIEVFEKDDDGAKKFGFGTCGPITGYIPEDKEDDDDALDYAFDNLLQGLQKVVASDDAVIIMEAGAEKLRYVTGIAYIVTKNKISCIDLSAAAVAQAAEDLENDDYQTQLEY